MAILNDSLGLLFRVTATTDAARDEFSKFKKSVEGDVSKLQGNFKSFASEISNVFAIFTGDRLTGVTSQITSLGNAVGAIPGPAGLAVGALAGLTAGAAAIGASLFKLSSDAADAGSKIHDMAEQTGLSTVTISSLKVAADQSDTSIDGVARGLKFFTLTMGQAAAGSVDAREKLKLLGVTSNDLDTGFAQVVKRIYELKPGIEQNTAAADAFGKKLGSELIPFINQFHGDLPGLIDESKRLGLTWSQDDADAADQFGDQIDTLKKQLEGAEYAIGKELLPVFLDFATDLSGWLQSNKGEVKSWGEATVTALEYVSNAFKILVLDAQIADEWLNHLMNTDRYYKLLDQLAVLEQKDKDFFEGRHIPISKRGGVNDQVDELTAGPPKPAGTFTDAAANKKALDEQNKAEEKAAKEREEIAKRDASARVDILKRHLQQSEELFKRSFDVLKATYLAGGDKDAFLKGYEDALTVRNKAVNDVLPKLTEAENAYAKQAKKTGEELKNLADEQDARQKTEQQKGLDIVNEKNRLLTEQDKKRNAESVDNLKARLDREYNLRDAASKTVLARMQYDVAEGTLTEEAAFKTRTDKEKELANLKLSNLEAIKAAMVKFGLDTAEIDNQIGIQKEAIETQKQTQAVEGNAIVKKGLEDEKRLNEEILRIRQQITEEERRLRDLEYDAQRKELELRLAHATGPNARALALKAIADLDIANARRVSADRDADIDADKRAELEKVNTYANAEQLKIDIEKKANAEHEANAQELTGAIKGITDQLKIDTDPFEQLRKSWHDLKEEIKDSADLHASLASIGELSIQIFQNMKAALVSAIEGWLLYGNSIGKALRQALAAELAHVAAVAAVHALEAAAWGFYFLATGQWVSAAHAFTSAALWGALAVTTGLAAKALAVKQTQTAATTGAFGTAGTAPGQSTNTSGEGTRYSSFGNDAQIVDTSRNMPSGAIGPQTIVLRLESNDSHIIRVVRHDVNNGGQLRELIIDTAAI